MQSSDQTSGNCIIPDNKRNSKFLLEIMGYVKLYVKKAGLDESIHPHTFRHTYATKVYETMGDLKIVQDLLGHKNLATTSIYAHTSDAQKRAAINKVFGKR